MVVGYVRVSTIKQDTENQMGEISRWCAAHGVSMDRVVSETISSRKNHREIFALVDELSLGDTLVVTELSRLARSLKEMLGIIEDLMGKKVRLVILKEGIDIHDNNPAGKLTVSIIASIAEFERSMISMRTREAIQTKRDNGISVGRIAGSKNKEHKLMGKENKIREYLDKGVKKGEIAKMLGVGRVTLYRFLSEMGVESND